MNNYDAYVFSLLEANKIKKSVGFDAKKSDLDKDGKISKYEQKRGEAIANAMMGKNKKKKKK